jgi:hypothetical protein
VTSTRKSVISDLQKEKGVIGDLQKKKGIINDLHFRISWTLLSQITVMCYFFSGIGNKFNVAS